MTFFQAERAALYADLRNERLSAADEQMRSATVKFRKTEDDELSGRFRRNLLRYGLGRSGTGDITRELGLSRSQLVRYLSGDGLPSLKTAMRIAEFLGVSLNQLLEDDEAATMQEKDGHAYQPPDYSRIVEGCYLEVSPCASSKKSFQVSFSTLNRRNSSMVYRRISLLRDMLGRSHFLRYRGTVQPTQNGMSVKHVNTSVEQDFGTTILTRSDIVRADLFGIRLATEDSKFGLPFSVPIFMEHVGESLAPSVFRECCGIWRRDDVPERIQPIVERLERDAVAENVVLRISS